MAGKPIETVISENLKALRQRQNLSQRRLADRAKMDVRTISGLENHPAHLNTKTLEKLAAGLGVSVADLVRDDGEVPELTLPRRLADGLDEAIRVLRSVRARVK